MLISLICNSLHGWKLHSKFSFCDGRLLCSTPLLPSVKFNLFILHFPANFICNCPFFPNHYEPPPFLFVGNYNFSSPYYSKHDIRGLPPLFTDVQELTCERWEYDGISSNWISRNINSSSNKKILFIPTRPLKCIEPLPNPTVINQKAHPDPKIKASLVKINKPFKLVEFFYFCSVLETRRISHHIIYPSHVADNIFLLISRITWIRTNTQERGRETRFDAFTAFQYRRRLFRSLSLQSLPWLSLLLRFRSRSGVVGVEEMVCCCS